MNPRTAALAYRIWAYATPRGWDVTITEIAEALGEPMQRINLTLRHRGWLGRVRIVRHSAAFSSLEAGQRATANHVIREIVGTEGLPE